MKLEQQQQAERLYFQTGLSKTQIAETLGINRRTLHNWVSENKFKERYGMLGFNDAAKLDEGSMWPVAFAVTKLTAADETKIRALVKNAVR